MTGPRSLRLIGPSLALQLAVYLSGVAAVAWLNGTFRVSRYLFATVDVPGFVIGILTFVLLVGLVFRTSENGAKMLGGLRFERAPLWPLILLTATVSMIATHFVFHDYALSMDEWMPRLQAKLFLSGRLVGQVGSEWQEYGRAMFHTFATYDPETGEFASSYRPGMAAVIALFDTVGLGLYASAFLNAGAVGLVVLVTRQLSPESRSAPFVAALLLATSQQAFAASMTSYAMSGHLFFNLLWLHLFLRDTLRAHFLAAIVGVITASLHQVHMHLFFALPFLLTLLRPLRLKLVLLYGSIYLVGHLAVLSWDKVLIQQVSSHIGGDARTTLENIVRIVRIPGLGDLASVWANLSRLLGWQSLAIVPLLLALWKSQERAPWMRLLLASIAVSLLPYLILMPDQGHGWGYRYLHGLLGNIAILAAVGWEALSKRSGSLRQRAAVVALLVISPLVMLTLRAVQIEAFVAPYAAATDLTRSQDADVVLVDNYRVFVGGDIPRNDPVTLDRPVVMILGSLAPEQITELCRLYRVKLLSVADFRPLGLRTFEVEDLFDREGYEARLRAFDGPGCQANP